MYEADGIDLTKSEYDELRNIERHGDEGPYVPLDETKWTCRRLYQSLHLIKFNERTMEARLTRQGRDWLVSYDYSVKKSHHATFREVLLAVWSVIGGAAAGGIVTYLLFRWHGIT